MELHTNDLHFVVTRIPRDVRKLMKTTRITLGGGFIRETIAGNKAHDVDLFGASEEVLSLAANLLAEKRSGRVIATDNAFTVLAANRMPIQFISRWLYERPEQVIQSFDFTVCQAAIWFDVVEKEWRSEIGADFYRDLAARRLSYTFPQRNEDAGGSLMRVRKFLARGYTIQAPSLAGVVARLAMAVRWPEVHDEQGAAKVLSGLLREVDPNIVVDGVDLIDEHQLPDDEDE